MLGRDDTLNAKLRAQLNTWPLGWGQEPEAPIQAIEELLDHVNRWGIGMEGHSAVGQAFADSVRTVLAKHLLPEDDRPTPTQETARTVDYVGALQEIDLVFRPDPANLPDLVFVEAETPNGRSVEIGTWRMDEDSWHRLRIRVPVTDLDAASRNVIRTHG